jgi:hypothetical protein
LPIPPSPNLKSAAAIYLYPSLCLFEGTDVSVGRGTETPFEIWGHPEFKQLSFSFTPVSSVGAKNPPHLNEVCYGKNLHKQPKEILTLLNGKLNLGFVKEAYELSVRKDSFFTPFFEKLAGNATLREQLKQGLSEEAIRQSWQPGLLEFKAIRKKYLLYQDFE